MTKETSTLNSFNIEKWVPGNYKCTHCGSTDTEYDMTMVLTSCPPKYNCRCKSCKGTFYGSSETIDLPFIPPNTPEPKNNYNYGWVCPKCGRVNAPFVRTCDCTGWGLTWTGPTCGPTFGGTTIGTTTLGTDTLNGITSSQSNVTSINEEMKNKFLNESDSVFEAVDKYKDWEKKQQQM